MQSYSALSSTLLSALLLSSVSSSPIKRTDDLACKFESAAFLTLRNGTNPSLTENPSIIVGLDQDGYLVAKPKEVSEFGFYSCDSDYMKYQTQREPLKDGEYVAKTTYYGHLAKYSYPNTDATDCLTYDPSTKFVSDSESCSFKDDDSQNLEFFSYENSNGNPELSTFINFLGGPNGTTNDYYITLSDDGRLEFNTGKPAEGTDSLTLAFPGALD